jgi:hypothetical protein
MFFRCLKTSYFPQNVSALLLSRFTRGMSVTADDIERRLRDQLGATHVKVTDTSGGCGASFALEVVSPTFEGMFPLVYPPHAQK